jgi:ribosomal protein S27E
VKKIRLKCPNCGHRIADYSGNSEALALMAEANETQSDVVNVKCHLCKSQVSILLDSTAVYECKKTSSLTL